MPNKAGNILFTTLIPCPKAVTIFWLEVAEAVEAGATEVSVATGAESVSLAPVAVKVASVVVSVQLGWFEQRIDMGLLLRWGRRCFRNSCTEND